MGEGGAEVCAVDGAVARGLRGVDILAAAAVELDGLLVGHVCQTDWKQRLGLAQYARAATEISPLVLLKLTGNQF